MSRRSINVLGAIAAGLGVCALAATVETGALNGVDRYAASHWMPELTGPKYGAFTLQGLLLPNPHGSVAAVVIKLWMYPASPLVSTALFGACCYLLWRRRRTRAAVIWCSLWIVGNVIEVAGKLLVARPRLQPVPRHPAFSLNSFDHSFPSGHTIRALLLAAVLAHTWPRTRQVAWCWGATALVALILNGNHVPSDVLGGVLVVAVLLLTARARSQGRRAASGGSPAFDRSTTMPRSLEPRQTRDLGARTRLPRA